MKIRQTFSHCGVGTTPRALVTALVLRPALLAYTHGHCDRERPGNEFPLRQPVTFIHGSLLQQSGHEGPNVPRDFSGLYFLIFSRSRSEIKRVSFLLRLHTNSGLFTFFLVCTRWVESNQIKIFTKLVTIIFTAQHLPPVEMKHFNKSRYPSTCTVHASNHPSKLRFGDRRKIRR